MEYNLANNIVTSLEHGNVSLNTYQLKGLIESTATINLSDTAILCIDCDLGTRIKVNDLRYYFSSTSESGTVSSGIQFYYKDESFDPYYLLQTELGDGYYYTSVSGLSAPRYVRFIHTLSGTSVSGTATCFEILNADDVVDFGEDSTKTEEYSYVSMGTSTIKEIPVYNNGDDVERVNAFVSLEPQNTYVDSCLYISDSRNGPWVGVRDIDLSIADYVSDNWLEGSMAGVIVDVYNKLIITTHDYSAWTPTNVASWCKDGGVYGFNTDPENAFLYDTSYWYSQSNFGTAERWATYMFPTPVCINTISVIAYSNVATFNTFKVFGSNTPREDNAGEGTRYIQETQLFSQNTITNTPNVRVTHTFENDTKYSCYTFQTIMDSSDLVSGKCYIYLIEFYNTNGSTYESKIFEKTYPPHTYLNVDTVNTDNTIVTKNSSDASESIEVRHTNTRPKRFHIMRYGNPYNDITFYDRWIETGETWRTDYYGCPISGSIYGLNFFFNKKTGTGAVLIYFNSTTIYSWGELYTIDIHGIVSSSKLRFFYQATVDSGDCTSSRGNKVCFDSIGGMWFYVYVNQPSITWSTSTGYYLAYITSGFSTQFKIHFDNNEVGYMDVVYDTGHLWYASDSGNQITRINKNGEVQVTSQSYIDEVKGLCTASDGGCWYVDTINLCKMDVDGYTTFEVAISYTDMINAFEMDGDERGFWILDGYVLEYITTTGTILFAIPIEYAGTLHPVDGGVWVRKTDTGDFVFVDSHTGAIEDTLDISANLPNTSYITLPGFFAAQHDHEAYSNWFPMYYDTDWNDLEWTNVLADDYTLPEESFHQTRSTLRNDLNESGTNVIAESPQIGGIYAQKSVVLQDVYPHNFKNLYLKIEVPEEDIDTGYFTSNLRVHWQTLI